MLLCWGVNHGRGGGSGWAGRRDPGAEGLRGCLPSPLSPVQGNGELHRPWSQRAWVWISCVFPISLFYRGGQKEVYSSYGK